MRVRACESVVKAKEITLTVEDKTTKKEREMRDEMIIRKGECGGMHCKIICIYRYAHIYARV